MDSTDRSRRLLILGLPFGLVTGLLGVGATEHRGPVLSASSGYSADRVAPFNHAVTFMALGAALVGRGPHTPAAGLSPFLPEILALLAGTFAGHRLLQRYAKTFVPAAIERCVPSALVAIGAAIVCAATLSGGATGLPVGESVRVPLGLLLGIFIGAVCRARGPSGADLWIPVLVLTFGVDIRLAGSAAAFAALPLVLAAIVRDTQAHGYARDREFRELTLPMGIGSALGAVLGGQLLTRAAPSLLMILLGAAFIGSAVRSFRAASRGVLVAGPA